MSITLFPFLFLFPYIISSYFYFLLFLFFLLIVFSFYFSFPLISTGRPTHTIVVALSIRHGRGAQARPVRRRTSPHGPRRHPPRCARRRPARHLQFRSLGSATCSSAWSGFATSSSAPPALALGARDLPSLDYSASTARAPSAGLLRL
jgi:cellulose synthase/poly-beta-1,6-N-acetylglucosamine synthase-like glycosyltransferase